MPKFSKKVMGKEVGDAKVYAKPHNMKGMTINALEASRNHVVDPNTLAATSANPASPAMRVSAGDPGASNIKTSGIAQRGHGAATKGFISRGPMA
jgi:hypothetical protein